MLPRRGFTRVILTTCKAVYYAGPRSQSSFAFRVSFSPVDKPGYFSRCSDSPGSITDTGGTVFFIRDHIF